MGYEIFSFWIDDEFPEDTNLEILEQYGLGKNWGKSYSMEILEQYGLWNFLFWTDDKFPEDTNLEMC